MRQKMTIIFFAILMLLLGTYAVAALVEQVNLRSEGKAAEIRKEAGEFRFEDYKSAEEAQTALLNLHPIGSETQKLIERFKQYGNITREDQITITYNPKVSAHLNLVSTQWVLIINNSNNNIRSLDVKKYLTGL